MPTATSVTAALAVSLLWGLAAPESARLWLFDLYERAAPPHRAASPIVVVDIDEASVQRFGRWPWPRAMLARLIDASRSARVIGLDILLLEPDQSAPDDAALETSMRSRPVVLAASRAPGEAAEPPVISVPPVLQVGRDPGRLLPSVTSLAWPTMPLADSARTVGLVAIPAESDGVLRRIPSLYTANGTLVPGFGVEAVRLALGADSLMIRTDEFGVQSVSVDGRTLPTDAHGRIWPRFAPVTPARTVSAADLLGGTVEAASLSGQIVLIGSSLQGLGDVHLTPLLRPETGTAIQAQFIASVLEGDVLSRPAAVASGEAALLALLNLLSLACCRRRSLTVQAAVVAVAVTLLAATSAAAFAIAGLLIDWIVPATGVLAFNLALAALNTRRVQRRQREAEADLATALAQVDSARHVVAGALASAKLATLGELAAVLAHELRQPIATMSIAAENAEASLRDGEVDVEDARRRIERILQQARRAESIIAHVGVFSRSDPGRPTAVDLQATVQNALQLVDPVLRRHAIQVELTADPALAAPVAPPILLEQVVLNLILNAKDALATSGRRDPAIAIRLANAKAGGVSIEVTDNGPGLSSDVLAHLFEPFLTTKPEGEGTGLGLSVCLSIVRSLGGTISAGNQPSGGAVFVVNLPDGPAGVSPEN